MRRLLAGIFQQHLSVQACLGLREHVMLYTLLERTPSNADYQLEHTGSQRC